MSEEENIPNSVTGLQLTYNEDNYSFPLNHRQWYICQLYLAILYRKNTSNLQLIKDVFSQTIPEQHSIVQYFQSTSDFRMKLRRVFSRWSHEVLGARSTFTTSTTSSSTNAAAQELQLTHGRSDKLYCFFSSVHRCFFHHNSHQASGSRRKPICAGFEFLHEKLKGEVTSIRRTDFVNQWNAIGKKIRDRAAMVIPPLVVENAGIQITTKIYVALSDLRDILHRCSFEDDQQIVSWSDSLIDETMKDNQEIKDLNEWLFEEVEKNLLSNVQSDSSLSSSLSSSACESSDKESTDKEKLLRMKIKINAKKIAMQATRQLIRSTINLRMKQVLRADSSLSCGKHEKTFRTVVAVLQGTDRNKKEKAMKLVAKKQKSEKKKSSNNKRKRGSNSSNSSSSSSSSSSSGNGSSKKKKSKKNSSSSSKKKSKKK